MNKEILAKYLQNRCTAEEFEEFSGWIDQEAWRHEGKNWSFDQWKGIEQKPTDGDEVRYCALLDRIHHQINLKHLGNEGKVMWLSGVATWLSRVAAILFIPLLGILFYLLSDGNRQPWGIAGLTVDSLEVVSPIGSRTVIELSDGTVVDLNYGSRIKYPASFSGERREVTLSGEGYFNVAHHPDQPFVVKTGKLNITALGTEFCVHAYPGDDVVAATLASGKLLLEKVLPENQTEKMGILVPGQHVKYYPESGKVTSTIGNIDKYIAWKEGKLVFDNDPIADVAETLGRMFNVDIEVADDIRYLSYTVTFYNDPLYLILDLMTETTPVDYRMFPRKRLPDGSFSKQKIRIEKRK